MTQEQCNEMKMLIYDIEKDNIEAKIKENPSWDKMTDEELQTKAVNEIVIERNTSWKYFGTYEIPKKIEGKWLI